jgi:hypothetical protein
VNLRALLLAVALLLAQQGALLHALEHAVNEVGIASLEHEIEECVAYDAVGHALECKGVAVGSPIAAFVRNSSFPTLAAVPTRTVFDSRAPPHSA